MTGETGRVGGVMSNPGTGIGREIAHGERAEAELDAFISRRQEQRRGRPRRGVKRHSGGRRRTAGAWSGTTATWRASTGGARSTTRPPWSG